MSRKVHAGGPSTIDGIRYQMLWSLFRTTELRVLSCKFDKVTGEIAPILRLEPVGGGGDLQEIGSSKVIIEQTKSRSTGKPWSLREVIDDILPDLYKAIDTNCSSIVYRFVTEGKIGDWGKVYDFFQNLHTVSCPASDILSSLDNTTHLPFSKIDRPNKTSKIKAVYWHHADYTQRSLFEHIVNVLRIHAPAKNEPLNTTQRKLWHLLSNFEMDGLRSMASLESAINDSLFAMGCPNTKLDETRRAMTGELEERSTSDRKDIDVQEFLKNYDLSVPITDWLLLRKDCSTVLHRYLKLGNYVVSDDVRNGRVQNIASMWDEKTPILVLSGQSGQGKTWTLYSVAHLLAEQRLVVSIDSTYNADNDIQKASSDFCEDVWQRDTVLPLKRIAAHLNHEKKIVAPQWLTLCIDGVQNAAEARNLARMDWEKWGINLLVSCSDAIAREFQNVASSRVKFIQVSDFTLKELHTYLSKRIGIGWPNIRQDMLDTLRRPLLANLYCNFAADANWQPTNEYELYSRYWRRIREQDAGTHSLDEVSLRGLARRLLTGTPYPWPGEVLPQADIDNDVLTRLISAGWLRVTLDGHYEIVHLRLLNWAVAEGLVAAYRAQEITSDELCDAVEKLYHSEVTYSNQNLGYVPMDVLWLLASLTPNTNELIDRIVLALERNNWHDQHVLYLSMLPTLGRQIVPTLIRRLETLPPSETVFSIDLYEDFVKFDADVVAPEALRLLANAAPHIRRFGCRVLAKCPSAIALDPLWAIHCDIYNNPNIYVQELEDEPGRMVYRANEESRDALLACVPLQPDWLVAVVKNADPTNAPMHDLARMATALEGHPDVWKQCKAILLATVTPQHDYWLAWNIYLHRDTEEISWLLTRIQCANDLGAQRALTAMTRVDPELTLQELANTSIFAIGLNERWCFSHLLLIRPEGTRSCILRHLQTTTDSWKSALAYSGSEDVMDMPTLKLLLDALEVILDQPKNEDVASNSSPLWNPLGLLCNIHRLELLECFMQRRGSSLEAKLTDWLLAKARQEHFTLQHENEDALTVLARFGGEGYTRVINTMLISKNVYAKYDGLSRAHKQPDAETLWLLQEIALQDGEDSRREVERAKAIIALARCEQWPDFIRGVVHCGFRCPGQIGDGKVTMTPLSDAAMAPAFDSLVSLNPSVGAILAVGVGQRNDKVDVLCDLIERVPANSEIAQACVQALGLLEDCGERAVHLLKEQLSIPNHYRPAWLALLRSGSDEAVDILVERITETYDHIVAINLLKRPRVAREVAKLVQNHLSAENQGKFFSHREFEELTAYLDDETLLSYVLQDDELQERLRESVTAPEGMIWYSGAKASAIHALSTSDKNEAYTIALTTLRNPESRDRERYPAIMVDLHSEKAAADLFDQMAVEKATAVRWAIGRVLSQFTLETMLIEKLQSPDAEERVAACCIATWQVNVNRLDQELLRRLEDTSRNVIHAAAEALRHRHNAPIIDSLITAYHQEDNTLTKWMLLDTILDLGDPGNPSEQLPEWIHRLCTGTSYLTWIYVREALDDSRKKLEHKASSHDFFSKSH